MAGGVRHKVARLFGRGAPDPVIERKLDATREQLAGASPEEWSRIKAAILPLVMEGLSEVV
jgi:hypothetical protein